MCSHGLAPLRGRFVAADLGLAPQVLDDGVDDRGRRERRAGVVQVRHVGAARRLGAGPFDVDRHRQSLSQ